MSDSPLRLLAIRARRHADEAREALLTVEKGANTVAFDLDTLQAFEQERLQAARAEGRREGLEDAIKLAREAVRTHFADEIPARLRALLAQSPPKEPSK